MKENIGSVSDDESEATKTPPTTTTSIIMHAFSTHKRRNIIVAVRTATLLITAVIISYLYVSNKNHAQALSDCTTAELAYKNSGSKEKQARVAADKLSQSTKKDSVADESTIVTLAALVKGAEFQIDASCETSLSTKQLSQNTTDFNTGETTNNKLVNDYQQASAKIAASVKAKLLADAKETLENAINSASSLLKDSNGKVADNATRETLTKAIDTANTTLKKDVSDPKTYMNAKTSLDSASKQMNDSIAKKQQDDAAAAANQAQQSQNSGNGNNYSGGNTYQNKGATTGNNGSTKTTPTPTRSPIHDWAGCEVELEGDQQSCQTGWL